MKDEKINGIKKGANVVAGQVIGHVGKMDGIDESMLHLELYSGKETGPLTNRNNQPYNRRGDLINPTDILEKSQLKEEVNNEINN